MRDASGLACCCWRREVFVVDWLNWVVFSLLWISHGFLLVLLLYLHTNTFHSLFLTFLYITFGFEGLCLFCFAALVICWSAGRSLHTNYIGD